MQGIPFMNVGDGENSYAANSTLQKIGISKVKPHITKAITELYTRTFPRCLTIADMGCSSGPNSFSVISEIIHTVDVLGHNLSGPLPEVQVFLNDLPGNDFNTIFKSIPCFHEQLCKDKGDDFPRCYITGVPGSFYGRLFPKNILMFVYSTYSLHWLSQVPEGIESNEGNIYIATTSPRSVFEAYRKQFNKDFSVFLRSRYEEMITGGRMVITVVGRRSLDPSSNECCRVWEILAESLTEMVKQGYVEEAKLHAFNMPQYNPSDVELRDIIQNEGSFQIDSLDAFDVNWDSSDDPENKEVAFDRKTSGRCVAKTVRAISESMLGRHFGTDVMDDLFQRFAEKAKVLAEENIRNVSILLCMTKKGQVTCL